MNQMFHNSLKLKKIFLWDDIDILLYAIPSEVIVKKFKVSYFDIPCSFDIEVSSFYEGESKRATMYIWQLGINGLCLYGRTWEQFLFVINRITEYCELNKECRMVFYVHNLGYEFQFIRKLFEWEKVFSISERKPIYALTTTGIEFRCSYLLSGYSLLSVGKNLQTYKVKKSAGDLDYNLIRHSGTHITEKELGYCINDIKVVMAYIQECIEADGSIIKIPMTKTGYVRRYCRECCMYEENVPIKKSKKRKKYHELMKGMQITSVNEYKQLKRAFQGGFTHANPFNSTNIKYNVGSIDFTSSYPTVMVAEKFPMTTAEEVVIQSKEELKYNLDHFCCLFDVTFTDLSDNFYYDNYISISRCYNVENAVTNNGRVAYADKLSITITEQDYFIIQKTYRWKKMKIYNFRRYRKHYLPTDFVKSILKLYSDKTTLKDVEGMEVEYLLSKGMLNSTYGMAVTDVLRDEIIYTNDEWGIEPLDEAKGLDSYNKAMNRFLFYPWGVWVTAYSRRNLWTGIFEFKKDYIYADTDSIKATNIDKHSKYIDMYNKWIRSKLIKACMWHGIEPEAIEPKTIKGITKTMGVWDFEGIYNRFKTLGAKRYMVETDKGINITVSGLNKKIVVPYLQEHYKDPFEAFNDDLYIPAGYTGKNTHTYIDEERFGEVTDYLGNKGLYHEFSSVHIEPSDYKLSLAREYIDFLKGITLDEIL